MGRECAQEMRFGSGLACAAEQLDLFLALVNDGLSAGSQQLAWLETLRSTISRTMANATPMVEMTGPFFARRLL